MDSTKEKEVVYEIPTFIKIYRDGSIERLRDTPIVPPCPEDPKTGVSSKDVIISVKPSISARIFIPKLKNENQKLPILVYYRGGAYFFESAFSNHHYRYLNHIVSEANIIAVAIEYRNAPEHFLPAGLNDCWVGLQWVALHSMKSPPSIDPWLGRHGNFEKVFIGGDSGGGNVVHNIVMRAGLEGLPGGVRLYGAYMNHPYFWGSKPYGREPVDGFEDAYASVVWNFVYPSSPGGLDNPMLNPMGDGAPSLARLGCVKMLISVAGKDFLYLRDRAVLYYESIKQSGWKGEVELFEEEEEEHCYHMNFPDSDAAHRLINRVIQFLRN
ncbi:2-hydroxyisoflavanone dehydratase-like [Senna tora]|uniref:2-hydroxyisoflavanone dehydratase-like n=1 Tax=Senna tora TaxID=362788 RepID=A0A834X2T6_9FABA|nr:2-hydroxyisoflavanone dehydratase-like [Senna tora]